MTAIISTSAVIFLIGAMIAFTGMAVFADGAVPSRQRGRWLRYGLTLVLVGALVMLVASFAEGLKGRADVP